ncbi:MAG: RNA 3'-terminal phosphate cyclase [Desulfobacter sp.]|nr:MAG: RNA 3'-terminal phosphate cyclase [Desulfobacter sp.]
MKTIDGTHGEGGGQILRTSLALSLVTGQPFTIKNIRARRSKPGLMRQHLTCVNAAARIGTARVGGAQIGSRELTFYPGPVRAGDYSFAIGTAGSCTLVLQTVLPALMTADAPSRVILEGGTHNPFAPPFDFLDRAFLGLINRMGPSVKARLERPGFYPAGGGQMAVEITPAPLERIEIPERGTILAQRAVAAVADLPPSIGEREIKVVQKRLGWEDTLVDSIQGSQGPGNILTLTVESEHITEVFTGFGMKGVSAEKVAKQCTGQARAYLSAGVPVGRFLADQLLLPMALAGGGGFATLPLSRHTTTNIDIIRTFMDIEILARETGEGRWEIKLQK